HEPERQTAGMARDSLRAYRDMGRLTGRTVGYRGTGVLTLAGPDQPEEIEDIRAGIAMQRSIGINVKEVGAEEIRLLVPGAVVAEGSVGAYEPDGGIVDPKQTLEVFASLARSSGATVRMGTEIQSLIVENGRVTGVKTNHREIKTNHVVLTAGPWTASLLKKFDVETQLRTLRPSYLFVQMPGADMADDLTDGEDLQNTDYRRKDELGLLGTPDIGKDLEEEMELRYGSGQNTEAPAPHPVIYDLEHDFYAKPDPAAGSTRISRLDSSLHPEVSNPDDYDKTVDPALAADLRERLQRRLPAYKEQEDIGTDCNLVCAMGDGRGVLGPVDQLPGLFVITGFMGQDFNLAPSIGEGVAQMLRGEPVSAFSAEFFTAERL
ncbi:MAG: FAD-binding oxidoreductase, partial [Planctomycetota bacterium]